MESKTLTIVYTDLSGSSAFTKNVGNVPAYILKGMHFTRAGALLLRFKGTKVKETGDGILAYFENSASALRFASALQIIEQKLSPFGIKIGMAHGDVIVDLIKEEVRDISGNGANFGARVQGIAKAGEVVIDEQAFNNFRNELGKSYEVFAKSFEPNPALKDYPEIHHLWQFDWRGYNLQEHLVAEMVTQQLDRAGFELTNFTDGTLDKPGKIFWPVSPRLLATAIHRGQLEAIRLLSICGWKVYLFITDSESLFSIPTPSAEQFERKIIEYALSIGIKIEQVYYMSRFYAADVKNIPEMLARFHDSASANTVRDIVKMEGKDYEDGYNIVMNRTLLKFLRPTFTTVAFQKFLDDNPIEKIMIIAGSDERTRWNVICTTQKLYDRMPMVFNPELKKGGHTQLQGEEWPFWRSKQQFLDDMDGTNLLDWAFKLFVLLPNFPNNTTLCSDQHYCDKPCDQKCLGDCPQIKGVGDRLAEGVKGKFWAGVW